jgi:UDP-GlcNAc:undecaprenyl-phosphate/decaprenyl-phosphate GlcNAc-1-phosphate transferase
VLVVPSVPGALQLTSLWPYLVAFFVAGAVTFLLTPVFRKLAISIGVLDHPSDRGVHEKPTPYLGGLAMLAGLTSALWVASHLGPMREALAGRTELWGVAAGGAVVCAMGALDDMREVSAPAKIAGQILAGSVMSFLGITMLYFRIPFGDFVVLGRDLAPLATIVWVVGMTNAINIIDGLDGLASGVVGLASIAFFIFSFTFLRQGVIGESNVGPLIAAVTAGVALGFLPWNWNPARIFMGDSGSYLLGILMAASTIVVGGNTPDVFPGKTYFFFAPLAVPLVILGVAIFDAGFAVLRRVAAGRAWHAPDKDHLHHRLLRLGHGHRRAVLILYSWTALLSAIVLVPILTGKGNALLPLLIGGVAVGLYTFLRPTGRDPERAARRARRESRRAVRQPA